MKRLKKSIGMFAMMFALLAFVSCNKLKDGKVVEDTYTGNVNVAMTWLDPTAEDLDQRMPGSLLGFDNESTVVSLETFGMIGVELTDDNNNPLNFILYSLL